MPVAEMLQVFVDSNVLLNVLTDDSRCFVWSAVRYRTYFPTLEIIAPD